MTAGAAGGAATPWEDVPSPAMPHDTGGRLVYAVGDVHGCYDQLRQILAMIAADVADRGGGRTPILVLLGDYVDRGPASAQVLEAVAWLRGHDGFEVHALAGNHEAMLRDFLDDPAGGTTWLANGGIETLRSYGIAAPERPPAADLPALRDAFGAAMPAAHRALLDGLDLLVEVGDYAFVHAGIRPGVALDRQSADDLLWIRAGFLDHARPFPKLIVHGHSWTGDRPQFRPNRFGIDTGVYATDVLTALRLDGTDVAFAQAGRTAS